MKMEHGTWLDKPYVQKNKTVQAISKREQNDYKNPANLGLLFVGTIVAFRLRFHLCLVRFHVTVSTLGSVFVGGFLSLYGVP